MRLIDADKVLAEFPVRRNHRDEKHGNMYFINGVEMVMDYLDEIANTSAIDAAPVKHGEWKKIQNFAKCSECMHEVNWGSKDFLSPYCPNCGTKMDGGTEK